MWRFDPILTLKNDLTRADFGKFSGVLHNDGWSDKDNCSLGIAYWYTIILDCHLPSWSKILQVQSYLIVNHLYFRTTIINHGSRPSTTELPMLTYDPSTAENTALAVFNQGKDANIEYLCGCEQHTHTLYGCAHSVKM